MPCSASSDTIQLLNFTLCINSCMGRRVYKGISENNGVPELFSTFELVEVTEGVDSRNARGTMVKYEV